MKHKRSSLPDVIQGNPMDYIAVSGLKLGPNASPAPSSRREAVSNSRQASR